MADIMAVVSNVAVRVGETSRVISGETSSGFSKALQMFAGTVEDTRGIFAGRDLSAIDPSSVLRGEALVTRSLAKQVLGVETGIIDAIGGVHFVPVNATTQRGAEVARASDLVDAISTQFPHKDFAIHKLAALESPRGFVDVQDLGNVLSLKPAELERWKLKHALQMPFVRDSAGDVIRGYPVDLLGNDGHLLARTGQALNKGAEQVGAFSKDVASKTKVASERLATAADVALGGGHDQHSRLMRGINTTDARILEDVRAGLPEGWVSVASAKEIPHATGGRTYMTPKDLERWDGDWENRKHAVQAQLKAADTPGSEKLRFIPRVTPLNNADAVRHTAFNEAMSTPPPVAETRAGHAQANRKKVLTIAGPAAVVAGGVGIAGILSAQAGSKGSSKP